MSAPPTPDPLRVLVFMRRDGVTDNVRRLLEEEGLSVEICDPSKAADPDTEHGSAGAWIVDEALEPAEVARAVEKSALPATAPVFVVARRLPARDRYLAWLEAGAWDILKIPLEGVALSLRLRNILGGPRTPAGAERTEGTAARYAWDALVRVANETHALARRYERPLHCLAVGVARKDGGSGEESLVRRLAEAVQRLTRRSDLVGIGEDDALIVLLPDTDGPGADTFAQRVGDTLRDRLREWSVPASLTVEVASAANTGSGEELLDLASEKLRSTRP